MSYKVEKIIVYPVKSLAGIEVSEQKALSSGFEWDRKWMLVDDNNEFISQRKFPVLAIFQTSFSDDNLIIKHKNDQLEIPKFQEEGNPLTVKVWSHFVDAIEVSHNANNFFSKILGQPCKLVKMNKNSERFKTFDTAPGKTDLTFADGYPYLILGKKSLEHLNTKLSAPVGYDRFRPNFLINTDTAHQEDEWSDIMIGDQIFRMVKPCVRCNVISVNQVQGIQTKEPGNTLATYRKIKNNIIFAMNAICLKEGLVGIDSQVSIIK